MPTSPEIHPTNQMISVSRYTYLHNSMCSSNGTCCRLMRDFKGPGRQKRFADFTANLWDIGHLWNFIGFTSMHIWPVYTWSVSKFQLNQGVPFWTDTKTLCMWYFIARQVWFPRETIDYEPPGWLVWWLQIPKQSCYVSLRSTATKYIHCGNQTWPAAVP